MLGVMTIRKAELRFREFDRYRCFYCGVCHELGRRCGPAGRLALSFEMTFLAMLLTSLYEPPTEKERKRCVVHPIGKQDFVTNEATAYCADLSVMLSYYDLLDGWEDEHRADRLAESRILRSAAVVAGKRLPEQSRAIQEYVRKLHAVEEAGDPNLDAAANLTGELLGTLYVMKQDFYAHDLRELGFSLGKFIYLCDCFEDLERDEKKKNYNPLLLRREDPDFNANCQAMLNAVMADASAAFERLPVLEDAEIMRNILYSGIWLHFENAVERRKAKKEK